MTRLRVNVQGGVISDSPLTVGATTVFSSAFAELPTFGAPDDLLITLDPPGFYGDPEIVRVIDHAAAATNITVVRGHDGTVARIHPSNTIWVCAPYIEDVIVQCTSSTRPGVGLYEGMRIFETDTDRELRWTGTDWQSFVEPYLPDVGWMLYR